MAYCTIEDMVCFFGTKEILCLGDRTVNRDGDLTTPEVIDRIQKAIDYACAEIDHELACCFDVRELKTMVSTGSKFTLLEHWNSDVARYHLYDKIQLGKDDGGNDHESYRRYKQAMKQLKTFCECKSPLCDENKLCLYPLSVGVPTIAVEVKESCFPEPRCCCSSKPCKCGY